MSNEEIFEVLQTKGKDLANWLKENFDPYVAIVITETEIKIIRTEFGYPINYLTGL